METPCVASIDQGTSSSRVLLVSSNGRVVSSHQVEHKQYYPTIGHVEHDPLEIWKNVKICLTEALKKSEIPIKIVAIGITNQRETTVVWNKKTGIPYHHAIVWNDTRTGKIAERLINKFGDKNYFQKKTGLPIASYFSATKLMYLLENIPEIRKDAETGDALFGTIDTWLIWKLTGGHSHSTDVTNASRTLLMDLKTIQWSDEILAELNIPRSMLPKILASADDFGRVDGSKHLEMEDLDVDRSVEEAYRSFHRVPVTGVIGDQQAALFGQACFSKGDAKCTYGTGAFLLLNTGEDIVYSNSGLLTTVFYQLSHRQETGIHDVDRPVMKPVYALEGSVAYSGSVIQWLRDNLQIISSAAECSEVMETVPDNGGVYFVPAFAGLYAPHWRADARGIIAGLTAYNTRAHVVRAACEASAFQTIELVDAMKGPVSARDAEDGGGGHSRIELTALRVDGGLTANNELMQFQSDMLGLPLIKPKVAETTAMGAAFMAGLGAGLWRDLEEVKHLWHAEKEWGPGMSLQQREKLLYEWKKAQARSLHWLDNSSFDVSGARSESSSVSFGPDPFLQIFNKQQQSLPRAASAAAIATAAKSQALNNTKSAASSSARDLLKIAGPRRAVTFLGAAFVAGVIAGGSLFH